MARPIVKVTTQAELDAALAQAGAATVWICGDGRFVVWLTPDNKSVEARGSAHVEARESAHVEARESAHVEARGSAHVAARGSAHVVARESAHVEAWESAHVVARESASVHASDSSTVNATKCVAVQRRAQTVTVTGAGVVIDIPPITTAEEWCAYYGIPVVDGVAILFKAVRANFASGYDESFFWTPGTTPSVPRMDDRECGIGLHAVPHPVMALRFYDAPDVRFIAVPVRVAGLRVTPSDRAEYPYKVKFQAAASPVYEVDRSGQALGTAVA